MVLDERHKSRRGEGRTGLAPVLPQAFSVLTLKRTALGQGARQQIDLTGIVGVVPKPFTSCGCMQQMVDVIAPLGRIEARSAVLATLQPASLVARVFGNQ